MKTTFYIIAISTLLLSCNVSTKGSWTDEDKSKARTELATGQADLEAAGIDFDKFADCVIEKCEKNYSNFTDADADLPGCEAIGMECLEVLMQEPEGSETE